MVAEVQQSSKMNILDKLENYLPFSAAITEDTRKATNKANSMVCLIYCSARGVKGIKRPTEEK